MDRLNTPNGRTPLAILVVASSLTLAACDRSGNSAGDSAVVAGSDSTAPAPAAASTPSSQPAALNDAQIAHIAVTANAIDSAAGEIAKQKASAKAVKDFAQTMITDHTGVNKQAVALATKLNVTPEDNDVSRQLQRGAEDSKTNLQALSGAAFDKAYMDHEVAYHQAVLDALDHTLIPGAQNAELEGLLEKVRPAIAAHLERAKGIQASLGK